METNDNVFRWRCPVIWMQKGVIDSSVLPFALAGGLGWRYRGNGSLVQGGGHFVDVVQSEEGENQAEWKEGQSRRVKRHGHKDCFLHGVIVMINY